MAQKILIATPLFPPDVGGPSYYAEALTKELGGLGHTVDVVNFSAYKHLPSGVRHLAYLIALLRKGRGASFILGFDMFSVGIPTIIAGRILGVPHILRVSGDFLWERASGKGEALPFQTFYKERQQWGSSETFLFKVIGWALRHASGLIFQNEWQRNILTEIYGLSRVPQTIIHNSFPGVTLHPEYAKKNFLWAGRNITLKNLPRLKEAMKKAQEKDSSLELTIITALPQKELFARIQECYAVINPSLSEMNPNIVLEGVRFGKPFICTKETGVTEVLDGAGLFVDPEDVAAIEKAILELTKADTYRQYQAHIAKMNITHTYADIAKEILGFVDRLSKKALPTK